MSEQTIEIDCDPWSARPNTYIAEIVKGTCLEGTTAADPENTVSRFFGNWVWSFPTVSPDEWLEVQRIVRPRIEKLFRNGNIRYGSW